MWDLPKALAVCRLVEEIAPKYGCHVALTGGCLYKDGPRKDLDLLFYRIRQTPTIDTEGLFAELAQHGIVKQSGFRWCFKATMGELNIDIFFPEEKLINTKSKPRQGAAYYAEAL